MGTPLEKPVALQRDEVMVNGRGGRQTNSISDLTHRWRIAAVGNGMRDVFDDPLSALDVVTGHVEATVAEQVFYRQADAIIGDPLALEADLA